MDIIDSHQHFWQVGRFDYPWMSREISVLCRDYLPGDLAPILRQNGVSRTVLVQASNSLEETRWLLTLAEKNQFVAGVVGWVDLRSSEVRHQLKELTANKKFKGVRHLVESEPADDWLVQPDVLRGLKVLAGEGVSYDLLVHTRHLKHVRTVAQSCPELSLVIDHLAKPPIASRAISLWSEELKKTAVYSNVLCKLSGLVTEADHLGWKVEHLGPVVDCALEFFGPRRLMFGSDYPVCLLAASYRSVLQSFQELLQDLDESDLEQIFSVNVRKFYRLETSFTEM